MSFRKIIKISRPRFWLYEAGSFLVGLAAVFGLNPDLFLTLPVLIFLFFFLYPANIFIYGLNDIFDYETDRLNPKKVDYEALVSPTEHRQLAGHIFLVCAPFIVYAWLVFSFQTFMVLTLFLFLASFYSAPPIRAKARPVIDSLFSAGHYVVTGVFGYLLALELIGEAVVWIDLIWPALSALLWASAMHAYSAVPDIEVDRGAGLATVATWLGSGRTVFLCAGLYLASAWLIWPFLGLPALILGVIYVAFMVLSGLYPDQLFRFYTYFPILNSFSGMVIFFLVAGS